MPERYERSAPASGVKPAGVVEFRGLRTLTPEECIDCAGPREDWEGWDPLSVALCVDEGRLHDVHGDVKEWVWGDRRLMERDLDGDGYTLVEGDCDDGDANIRPGAEERYNGLDDDCDGEVDAIDRSIGCGASPRGRRVVGLLGAALLLALVAWGRRR